MKKKTAGYWVLNAVSILSAFIFIAPILWVLAVSFQHQGKQISSVIDWFTPPYTLENYPNIILNSGVPGGVLREFYDSSIGPLAEYDRENKTELLESLEIYLLENRSISAAAARLYIHRNTMNYRINKIKQILSVDFDDSENLLKLQLGIKIMRVLKGLGMK